MGLYPRDTTRGRKMGVKISTDGARSIKQPQIIKIILRQIIIIISLEVTDKKASVTS